MSATIDDACDAYWDDDRQARLVCQAQQFAAQCARIARWAAAYPDHGYTVWCQQRADRAAETARMMRDLAATRA